jgi:hypothetical protein
MRGCSEGDGVGVFGVTIFRTEKSLRIIMCWIESFDC